CPAPFRLAVLLFPAFTALDVFGPLGVLNLLSIEYPMTLSLVSTDMQPVSIDRTIIDGVYQGMPTWQSQYFAEYVLPTHTLDDAPEFDAIMVPGGAGSRNLNGTEPHVEWLKERMDDANLQYMMTVCTGTSLLARTGKIAGKNATTNKAAFDWVTSVEHAEDVNWIAKARWVVDGKLWTSSGVSAGTDMTLGWIAHQYGKNESEKLRVAIEWVSLNQTEDPFAALYGLA
ncbi:class I glutamine amidotransferase-like protein, partial [Xylariomycetidae sp. FL0641]